MRELSPEATKHAAEALETYLKRGGNVEFWLKSKDYTPQDQDAILAKLNRKNRE